MRPTSIDDAGAVAAVIAACQLADTGKAETTAEEILDDWQAIDLAEDAAVVVAPNGHVVANADILNRSYISVSVYGYVHPEHRGLGMGRALVEWGESWAHDRMDNAPEDARVVAQHYLPAANAVARELRESLDYAPVRGVYTMEIELPEPPPSPEWPDGVTVRTFVPGQDEQAVYETVEESFRDLWGRPKNTFERFLTFTRADSFDPDLWFLAEDRGEISGICLCKIVAGQAVVETVGVLRPWRGRGLGLAMLRHAFGVFHQRCVHTAWLSVDAESITGAPRLYQRAGMHVTGTYIIHQKELRAGRLFSARSGVVKLRSV
jgi:mycothiol synthase